MFIVKKFKESKKYFLEILGFFFFSLQLIKHLVFLGESVWSRDQLTVKCTEKEKTTKTKTTNIFFFGIFPILMTKLKKKQPNQFLFYSESFDDIFC